MEKKKNAFSPGIKGGAASEHQEREKKTLLACPEAGVDDLKKNTHGKIQVAILANFVMIGKAFLHFLQF